MKAAIAGLRQRVWTEGIDQSTADEIIVGDTHLESRELLRIVAVVDDHVVTRPHESSIGKATKPSHHATLRVTTIWLRPSPTKLIVASPSSSPRLNSIRHSTSDRAVELVTT